MVSQIPRLQILKDRGYQPKHVLDIGACFGEWADDFYAVFPGTDILLIEANEERRESLTAKGLPFEISLLGEEEKQACTFYVGDRASTAGNSIYREQTNFFFNEVEIPMQTLDSLLERSGRAETEYDFIKLDVQGAELDILKGAPKTLEHAEFVLMELRLLDYNQGAPTFADAIIFMNEAGFRPCDMFETHCWLSTPLLSEVDLLFAKEDSWVFSPPVESAKPAMPPESQARVLNRLIPILAPNREKKVYVIHDTNDDLVGNYMGHQLREAGCQCEVVPRDRVKHTVAPGSVAYVLPGAFNTEARQSVAELGCVTITGYPELVRKGDVSIGIDLAPDGRVKIIGSSNSLNRHGVNIPDGIKARVEMVAHQPAP